VPEVQRHTSQQLCRMCWNNRLTTDGGKQAQTEDTGVSVDSTQTGGCGWSVGPSCADRASAAIAPEQPRRQQPRRQWTVRQPRVPRCYSRALSSISGAACRSTASAMGPTAQQYSSDHGRYRMPTDLKVLQERLVLKHVQRVEYVEPFPPVPAAGGVGTHTGAERSLQLLQRSPPPNSHTIQSVESPSATPVRRHRPRLRNAAHARCRLHHCGHVACCTNVGPGCVGAPLQLPHRRTIGLAALRAVTLPR
jgi:hypothetical protein